MLLISRARASANSATLIPLGACEKIEGVDFTDDVNPGMQGLFLFRPALLSATFLEESPDAILQLIFLHGLGDTGHGWSEGFSSLKGLQHVKFICPNAPVSPVTLNGGFRMPSWFDILTLNMPGPEDEEGIKRAAGQIQSLIDEEIKSGIPSERIVLGGFSQGGALAVYTALTMEKTLGGILLLSSWLPIYKSFPGCIKGNSKTPILQCHGKLDPIVAFRFGEMTRDVLKSFCSKLEFKSYADMAHSSSPEEMADVNKWLTGRVPPTN